MAWPAYLYRAEAYLQVEELDAANRDFETVIDHRPQSDYLAIAYTGRGRIYMLLGQPHTALTELDRAVAADPKEPFAHYVRGLVHLEMDHLDEAQEDLEHSLALGLADERSVEIATQVLATLQEPPSRE